MLTFQIRMNIMITLMMIIFVFLFIIYLDLHIILVRLRTNDNSVEHQSCFPNLCSLGICLVKNIDLDAHLMVKHLYLYLFLMIPSK